MKRKGGFYEKIWSERNLMDAARKASKDKGNCKSVEEFWKDPEPKIKALSESLRTKAYKTSPYHHRTIWERKERVLSILPFYPDNICDHAIINVIGGLLLSVLPKNTHACIKGRGISGCMKAVDTTMEKARKWSDVCALKMDIHHYFQSVNHDKLKVLVRKKIKDADLLWLLDEIIDSIDGIPIGRFLSQYLSNYNLAWFDHYVLEVVIPTLFPNGRCDYERYMDDIVLIGDDKAKLHQAREMIETYLRDELSLSIKPNWQVFRIAENRNDKRGRGLDFIGFVWYQNQKLLRKQIKKNFAKKCGELRYVTKGQISSWIGWCKYSDSKHLFQSLTNCNYYDFTQRHKTRRFREGGQRRDALSLRHRGGDNSSNDRRR